MSERVCVVCGMNLDTLFEKARPNVVTCSNKCRQKRYRERKSQEVKSSVDVDNAFQQFSLDEARLLLSLIHI